MRDGWHIIAGRDIYIEDGYAVRGLKMDYRYVFGGEEVPAGIYKEYKEPVREPEGTFWRAAGWSRVYKVKPDTLRKGLKEGRYALL